MAKYSIFMQYDPQDKIYVASVPELQGCMAHGERRKNERNKNSKGIMD